MKVPIPIDKRLWQPSLLPGAIALLSTIDEAGVPNVAPKSWLQMVSFDPPILMFSGTRSGRSEQNIGETRCFGVNLVDAGLARRTSECVKWKGAERIEKSDFHLVQASRIRAPLVDNCKAHLECVLRETHEMGSALVVYGEIVAASATEDLLKADPLSRYALLSQALFLEDGRYAVVERALPVHASQAAPGEFVRYVYQLTVARPERFNEALVRAHVAHMKHLENTGRLELCGPFADGRGGMIILRGVTLDQAKAIAKNDPFVSSGAESFELRALDLSCRANDHMGVG